MVFSTDPPNDGSFMSCPPADPALMDSSSWKEMARSSAGAGHSELQTASREYSLWRSIIARPARLWAWPAGHLGIGADGDVTIYEEDADKEKMFSHRAS
jgi:formylmethanofuran dehydrogenase subunit A